MESKKSNSDFCRLVADDKAVILLEGGFSFEGDSRIFTVDCMQSILEETNKEFSEYLTNNLRCFAIDTNEVFIEFADQSCFVSLLN